jgi:hypothetical protein
MMRAVMVVVGVVAAGIVLGALLIDEGEVVTLMTTDGDSGRHETQLWTVELDRVSYLRASDSDSAWVARLRARPLVELESDGSSARYRAVLLEDPALRTRIDAAMKRKYGFADRFWRVFRNRSGVLSIRLDPAEDLASGHGDPP